MVARRTTVVIGVRLWWPFIAVLALAASACGAATGDEQVEGASTIVAIESKATDRSTSTTGRPVLSVDAPTGGSSEVGSITTEPTTPTTPPSTQPTTQPSTQPSTQPTTRPAPEPVTTPGSPELVRLRFESRVDDVSSSQFRDEAMAILTDPRGWGLAGFSFVTDEDGPYLVVLAEGPEVDRLCLPLETFGTVSCQNGPVVALNADRWRGAVDHWTLGVEVYRGYLVNHEVGHLLGQRHPKPRCPVAGRPAGVMEQQTAGLKGCTGNPWPRAWELDYARQRPVVYAPLPDWGPDPVPTNRETSLGS